MKLTKLCLQCVAKKMNMKIEKTTQWLNPVAHAVHGQVLHEKVKGKLSCTEPQ